MVKSAKYNVNSALAVVDGTLATDLAIHRFDEPTRTKTHLFSVNGSLGRQFAIIVGDLDKKTGRFKNNRTRIVLEQCEVPVLDYVEPMLENAGSHRLAQSDSKLIPPNQTSVLVTDESALKRLLRWYAGRTA
jgi:hypothetical protein